MGLTAGQQAESSKRDLDVRTLELLYAYVRKRESVASPRSCWPEIAYNLQRRGLVYENVPLGFVLARSTLHVDDGDAEEMGWALWSLPEWESAVIWIYATTENTQKGLKEWKDWKKRLGLSEKVWRSILLDLQEAAEKRGLV